MREYYRQSGGGANQRGIRAKALAVFAMLGLCVAGIGAQGQQALAASEGDSAKPGETVVASPDASTFSEAAQSDSTLGDALAMALIGEGEENLLLSPHGVDRLLALVGALSDPHLAAQIEGAVGGRLLDQLRVQAAIAPTVGTWTSADAIWLEKANTPINPKFVEWVDGALGAAVFEQDFEAPDAVDRINQWFADKTDNAIRKLFDRIAPDTSAILANVIYFQSPWVNPFEPEATAMEPFYGLGGGDGGTEIAMMHADLDTFYAKRPWGEVVELPFEAEGFSFLAALPGADADVEEVLPAVLTEFRQPADAAGRTRLHGHVAVPRMTFGDEHDLTPLIRSLGPKDLFSQEFALTKLSADPPMMDSISQTVRFVMDEKGATVAAATAAIALRALRVPEFRVEFNRPFVFAIRHRDIAAPIVIGFFASP